MSYIRVLPRDLLNEANLLKCYGRLWILLDTIQGHNARFVEEDVGSFEIEQDPNDGSISVGNITFQIHGERHILVRPLNSRRSWPLYALADDFEHFAVFDKDGNLEDGFWQYIKKPDVPVVA